MSQYKWANYSSLAHRPRCWHHRLKNERRPDEMQVEPVNPRQTGWETDRAHVSKRSCSKASSGHWADHVPIGGAFGAAAAWTARDWSSVLITDTCSSKTAPLWELQLRACFDWQGREAFPVLGDGKVDLGIPSPALVTQLQGSQGPVCPATQETGNPLWEHKTLTVQNGRHNPRTQSKHTSIWYVSHDSTYGKDCCTHEAIPYIIMLVMEP